MLTLNDGRNELWQWDTGRTLNVDAECSQVHFSNKVFGRSIDVDVIDGVSIIPDILLQTDKELTAWAFVGTPENGYTKISKVFKVNRRNKPADYVFTPTEQTTLGELVERLEKIEESQDPDAIKNAVDDYLANNPIEIDETDPTVSEWAKQPQKPAYTAQEVGALPATTPIPSTAADVNAEPSGAVAQHNVSDAAHSDIRLLIQGLSERLSAVADSDDTSLDQLSEIVAYIKSNKSLIDAITTSKVNVSDIVDNLTTNAVNKPLSAAQGVALKALINALTIPTALSELSDDATHRTVTDLEKAAWNAKSNFTGSYNDLTDKPVIPTVPVQSVNGKTGAVVLSAGDVGALPDSTVIPDPYTLPVASATQLGGVKPVAKTAEMTQSVGVDEAGALWAKEVSGGGGASDWAYRKITLSEAVSAIEIPFDNAKEVILVTYMRINNADNTLANANGAYCIRVNTEYAANINCYIRESAKYNAWHKIEKIKSRTQLFSTPAYDNGANWSVSKAVSQYGWEKTASDSSEYINSVSLAPYNNSAWVFPADCVVEVWYR